MNKQLSRNIIRALFVLLIQVVLLKRTDLTFQGFNYVHLTIYSIILALLPYKTPPSLVIVVGFGLGLFVDLFYDSLGVHAGAAVLVGYARHYVLQFLSPIEGYKKDALTAYEYGVPWFLSYMAILIFIHLLALYSFEAFSFVYIKEILLRTIFSFLASLFIVMIGMLIFNPKY